MTSKEPLQSSARVSTGLAGLDEVLDGLRIGDNVVWRVSDLNDYRRFVLPSWMPPLIPVARSFIFALASIHLSSNDILPFAPSRSTPLAALKALPAGYGA